MTLLLTYNDNSGRFLTCFSENGMHTIQCLDLEVPEFHYKAYLQVIKIATI